MIPRLPLAPAPGTACLGLLGAPHDAGFEGDLSTADADRTVLATDDSAYEIVPQAVAFPRGTEDLARMMRLLTEPRFAGVTVAPRGGGTGTNGQPLTDGVVVDVYRHMNRATIGRMVSTGASGQGSGLYGKTRDHVLELTTILTDGTVWHSRPLDDEELRVVGRRADRVGAIHRTLDAIDREHRAAIAARFPQGRFERIWKMRKRAVGLLGNAEGEARPVAFVESTAVPPSCSASIPR